MKKRQIFIFIIIFIFLSSCNLFQRNYTDNKVVFRLHDINNIRKRKMLDFYRSKDNDTTNFIYKLNQDTLLYSYYKLNNNDSIIFLYDDNKYYLESERIIIINRNEYRIYKYCYDKKDSNEEYLNYFLNENYGILVGSGNNWEDLFFSIEYDEISKDIIDSIIRDRTGFFIKNLEPPVPTDSLLIELN